MTTRLAGKWQRNMLTSLRHLDISKHSDLFVSWWDMVRFTLTYLYFNIYLEEVQKDKDD